MVYRLEYIITLPIHYILGLLDHGLSPIGTFCAFAIPGVIRLTLVSDETSTCLWRLIHIDKKTTWQEAWIEISRTIGRTVL